MVKIRCSAFDRLRVSGASGVARPQTRSRHATPDAPECVYDWRRYTGHDHRTCRRGSSRSASLPPPLRRQRVPDKRRICGAVQGAHPCRRWRAINLQRALPYKLSKIQPRFVHKGYLTLDFVLVEKITDRVNDFVVTRLTHLEHAKAGAFAYLPKKLRTLLFIRLSR